MFPLRFLPIFKRYLWGGRRLESVLGKTLPAGEDYAESWEVVDRTPEQSVVAAGPWAGRTLHDLVTRDGPALLGRHHPQLRFPLLFKFLDAHQQLSLQVHPDDTRAAQLSPPDLGKTEAWVVLSAEPGSFIHAGLKPGIDRETLSREIERGACESCVERVEARPGDCFFLPAGTVHALGAGLVVAEIQQSSNTTYRLYDWGRRGPDGNLRELHVQQALEVIDYQRGPVRPQEPVPTGHSHAQRLVACDKFVLDRWKLNAPSRLGGDDRCHILAVIQGSVRISGDPENEPLRAGGVVLLPAALGNVELTPQIDTVVLDAYLP